MLKQLSAGPMSREQVQQEVSAPELLALFEAVFRNDVRFRIMVILSNREGACLREIARNAGISHKNLSKYLDILSQKGVVEAYPTGMRSKVYKLSPKYSYLRYFL